MSNEFIREARYVVLKSADVMKCLTVSELIELRRIQAKVEEHRAEIGKPPLDCVVVESDWPEYDPTWKAIEVRVTGAQAQRRVVCAANRDKFSGDIIIGVRHWDQWMHQQAESRPGQWCGDPHEQGFIDQHGVFMDRREAWQVATAANQIIQRVGGDDADGGTLYSENLY